MVILIRVDASPEIGGGHLMRCLALAQALRRRRHRVFFATRASGNASECLLKESFETLVIEEGGDLTTDAFKTAAMAKSKGAAWIVLDGYHFLTQYQAKIKEARFLLCTVDDLGPAHFVSDVILNQNLGSELRMQYSHEPYTRMLLGHRYVLLREEFLNASRKEREFLRRPMRILVTMGASDPLNQTVKILRALKKISGLPFSVHAVVGRMNQHQDEIQKVVDQMSSATVVIDPRSMASEMLQSDLVLTAGGSTCWEAAYLGVPMITLVLSEDQIPVAAELEKAGVLHNLGWWENVKEMDVVDRTRAISEDPAEMERMSAAGRRLIDGLGGCRVVEQLEEILRDANN